MNGFTEQGLGEVAARHIHRSVRGRTDGPTATNEAGAAPSGLAFARRDEQDFTGIHIYQSTAQPNDRRRLLLSNSADTVFAQPSTDRVGAKFRLFIVAAELSDTAHDDGICAEQTAYFGG